MIIESVCVAFMPFRSFRQRATITGIRNGAGFPNRRTKLPGNLALILQDLSLTAFTFSEFIVHQKRTREFQNLC